MSIADDFAPQSLMFGAGGGEPYARAMRSTRRARLYLHEVATGGGRPQELDLARWSGQADEVDLRLLAEVAGPVLDIGCGPARMVRAAVDLGLEAWGVDVSEAVVDQARAAGLPVLLGSVFDPLPSEGAWQTVLLVDGNIGIGGDVQTLLARCAELISDTGEVVVETHLDPLRDRSFVGRVTDFEGRRSAEFPWAEAGAATVVRRAAGVGLSPTQLWSAGGRAFCRLGRITA